ncbi:hypothetical protein APHAL10511_000508 [Amanita phalloides]|nr:hypothetical protein APHAL10511_000508 [Amanita phalloides]
MPPAFLAVLSEPGQLVSLDEFQDWYDNEHIPLRMDHFSSFLAAARFSATDGQKPSWIALYDVDNVATFNDESYARLRTTRSPREADLVKRLEMLDRRTCRVVWDSGVSLKATSLDPANPTKVIATHELGGTSDDEGIKQAEELVKGLRDEKEWVRTRLFACIDTLKTGVAVPPGPEAQKTLPFLVLHGGSSLSLLSLIYPVVAEFITHAAAEHLIQGQPESRKWELYRAYPNLSQKA